MVYLINEFEGWSPLVKFNLFSSYDKVEIEINENICIGCERCIEVCPKGVYEIIKRKSKVVALKECISCKSCFYQCPVGAIKHSANMYNCDF
jgi:NAD-dependent dihydropyrimidine dehydrogenase PreA subunit